MSLSNEEKIEQLHKMVQHQAKRILRLEWLVDIKQDGPVVLDFESWKKRSFGRKRR